MSLAVKAVRGDYIESFTWMDGGRMKMSPAALEPVPDRTIMRRLKEYDPTIEAHWEPGHNRWFLSVPNRRHPSVRERILTVCEQDGSFRPLDERTVVNLMLADSFRYNDIHHFKNLIETRSRAVDEEHSRNLSNLFQERNEELYRAYFGSPSVKPAGGWKEFS